MILMFFEAVLDREQSRLPRRWIAIVLRWMRRHRGLEIEPMEMPQADPLDARRMHLRARIDAVVNEANAMLPPDLHINHRRHH